MWRTVKMRGRVTAVVKALKRCLTRVVPKARQMHAETNCPYKTRYRQVDFTL